MTVTHADLVYLGRSGLEIAPPSDDLRGLVVVDPTGLRIGEVDDVVVDVQDRRARLIAVVSGGILGFADRRVLLPVETITKVDDRVHLDRQYAAVYADGTRDVDGSDAVVGTAAAEAYAHFGVIPCWAAEERVPTVPA